MLDEEYSLKKVERTGPRAHLPLVVKAYSCKAYIPDKNAALRDDVRALTGRLECSVSLAPKNRLFAAAGQQIFYHCSNNDFAKLCRS